MAHIPPSAAIFSPSVARLVTSAAKDWNYVDSWLATKFHNHTPPPPFERNAETLKSLVALAAFNECVDEDRDAVITAAVPALRAVPRGANIKVDGLKTTGTERANDAHALPVIIARRILAAVEDDLTREGQAALGGLTSVSVELENTYPEPADLGCGLMELQARLFQLQGAASLNDALKAYVETDYSSATGLLAELDNSQFQPPADLARLNLELQRKVKVGAERLQDTRERTKDHATLSGATIRQLQENERTYVALLARSKDLDKKTKAFQGLPPDRDLARQRLEELWVELRTITQERDNVFESLIDKTSPKENLA